jgi:hypothetical protein
VTGAQLDALLTLMRDEASAAGRDPARLEVSLGHSVTKIDDERAGRLTAQGADRLVLAMPSSPISSRPRMRCRPAHNVCQLST